MRYILRKALDKYHEINVVADVSSGHAAVTQFEQLRIDIAFLDMDMPGLDGIETAKLILDINPRCAIVFVTAHDEYMKDAFELYAFDYILKPFKLDRLDHTVKRILEQTEKVVVPENDYAEIVSDDLLLKVKGGMVVIKKDDILIIERIDRQTQVITTNGQYMINKTLQEMEDILPSKTFLRSHKSYIIRINAIKSFEVYGRWTYIIKFHDSEYDALITKEKAKMLEKRFKSFD